MIPVAGRRCGNIIRRGADRSAGATKGMMMSTKESARQEKAAELRRLAVSLRGIAMDPQLSTSIVRRGGDCCVTAVRLLLEIAAAGLLPGDELPRQTLLGEPTQSGECTDGECRQKWSAKFEPWIRSKLCADLPRRARVHVEGEKMRLEYRPDEGKYENITPPNTSEVAPDNAYDLNARRRLEDDADVIERFADHLAPHVAKAPAFTGAPNPEEQSKKRPHWKKGNHFGELVFDGVVVRTVRLSSPKLVPILDGFEELGWPDTADSPLSDDPDGERLRSALKQLNKGLGRIRFHATGNKGGVSWFPL